MKLHHLFLVPMLCIAWSCSVPMDGGHIDKENSILMKDGQFFSIRDTGLVHIVKIVKQSINEEKVEFLWITATRQQDAWRLSEVNHGIGVDRIDLGNLAIPWSIHEIGSGFIYKHSAWVQDNRGVRVEIIITSQDDQVRLMNAIKVGGDINKADITKFINDVISKQK